MVLENKREHINNPFYLFVRKSLWFFITKHTVS
jgi:hypothetical protein